MQGLTEQVHSMQRELGVMVPLVCPWSGGLKVAPFSTLRPLYVQLPSEMSNEGRKQN